MGIRYPWACAIALSISAAGASAQSWPSKPIRIVTTEAGSATDLNLRLLNPLVTSALGQPIVVDNRASSSRPEQLVLKSPPDGHSFLYWGNPLWTAPFLEEVNYDPVKDFAPVSIVARYPSVLIIHAGVPANTVKELIALAKAKPKALNVGMAGVGSTPFLAAMLFMSMSGTDMISIGYKSTVQGMSDLTSGRVQAFFPSMATALPLVKAGKVRALAVTTTERSNLMPDVPPLAATLPGYEIAAVQAMFGVASTPPAIVNRFSQELAKAVKDAAVRDKLLSGGFEIVGSTPAQLADTMRSEMGITAKLVKNNQIRAAD